LQLIKKYTLDQANIIDSLLIFSTDFIAYISILEYYSGFAYILEKAWLEIFIYNNMKILEPKYRFMTPQVRKIALLL